MEKVELKEPNIVGFRKKIATLLTSKPFDICHIVLIFIYTILVLVFLSLHDSYYDDHPKFELGFQLADLAILFIFCWDIAARIYAFRNVFLRDKMNILDICLILLAILFTLLDMNIENEFASAVFRLRGIFRLIRVAVLIQKIDGLWVPKKSKKSYEIDYSDYKSPLERTIEILTCLKEDLDNQKYVKDVNFWIKNISNGKLYEMEMNEPETLGMSSIRRSRRGGILAMEENLWIRSCSTVTATKKLSRMSSMIVIMNRKSSALQNKMNITQKTRTMFEKVDNLDFNVFELKEESKDNELVTLAILLFEKHDLFKTCKISNSKFVNFTKSLQSGYKKVQYHNKTHGTDVAQTLYFFLMKGNWMTKSEIDNFDLIACIIGGLCHDYEHPGYNAAFLIKTNDKLTVRYNDISILENHHVAATYELLNQAENNIFEKFSVDDKKSIRKWMIEMILSTDMSRHFADLGKFKSRIAADNFDPVESDKQLCMNQAMHLADISNPSKKWDISFKWTEWLYEEFFAQGDKERDLGMQISDLMDRTTINIAKSSIGFVDVIVEPAYVSFAKFLPHLDENLQNIANNKNRWKELIGEYQEKVTKAQLYFEAHPPQVYVEEDEEDGEDSEEENSNRSFSNVEKSIVTPIGRLTLNSDSLMSQEYKNANSKTSSKD